MIMPAEQPLSPGTQRRGRRVARPSGFEREAAIISTTKKLLGEKSFQDISIDELTKLVGVSRPAFYFYFSSKESVLLALFDQVVEKLINDLDRRGNRHEDDPVEMWRKPLLRQVNIILENRSVVVAADQTRDSSVEIRTMWNQLVQHWIDQTTYAIRFEQRRGAAPADISAEELSISLNLMSERATFAACSNEGPRHDESNLVEALLKVWIRSIYLTTKPPTFSQLPPARSG